MRVLVTGATGFIGSRLMPALLAQGITVRALTRNPAHFNAPTGVEVAQGDVLDRASLTGALKEVDGRRKCEVGSFTKNQARPNVVLVCALNVVTLPPGVQ